MSQSPFVAQFISLLENWNAAGWGEYLAFEVIEEIPGRPFAAAHASRPAARAWFAFLEPFSKEHLELFMKLRDELRVWVFWDPTSSSWEQVSVGVWRKYVNEVGARVRAQSDGQQGTGT